MRWCRDRLLLSCGVVLVVATGCVAGEIGGEGAGAPGLDVRVDALASTFAADEIPWVEVTYTNESAGPLRVLSWMLPGEDLWQDLFTVTVDGVKAEYIGRVYKRADARDRDFVVLAPGESRTGRVDLSRLYEMPRAGEYQIEVKARATLFTGGNDSGRADAPTIASNRVALFSEAHLRPVHQDDVNAYYYGISFSQCSGSQKDLLRTGMDVAQAQADDAASYMNDNTPGNRTRYRTWFGAYTAARWATVKRTFATLKSRIDGKRIRFHCDCSDDYYAYVYPDAPYNIYICNVYWNASLEDKGGTIVHEMTHFYAVAGTADVVYGVDGCHDLARNDPDGAVENADSYAYFCELP